MPKMQKCTILTLPLLSTGKCKISDLLEENLARGSKIEFFARSSVDFIWILRMKASVREEKSVPLGMY